MPMSVPSENVCGAYDTDPYYHSPMRFLPIGFLILGNLLVWSLAFPSHTLRVSFLNIGQGDAILIQSPTGGEMLIDGGRRQGSVA